MDGKIIVLAEHQSTINENMPLRFLQYIARLYEKLQTPTDTYLRKLAKIPTPEFYVFYNGIENYPETGFSNAVKICIEKGILKEYLMKKLKKIGKNS